MKMPVFMTFMLFALLAFCAPAMAQADFIAQQERYLADAEAALTRNPNDADAHIWKGRRLGYLGRYSEAVAAFEAGETRHPKDARFARHIGHRLISLRRYEAAEKALERAATLSAARPDQTEPDGLPNKAGIPTSTLKGNIWYHLGLARYLRADFSGAARAYAGAAALAHNPDAASAARYWLSLSLARAGRRGAAAKALAPLKAGWPLIENEIYHRLGLCLRGDRDCEDLMNEADQGSVDTATRAYGVAMARLFADDREGAVRLLKTIVAGNSGTAFARLAAEADLARLTPKDR